MCVCVCVCVRMCVVVVVAVILWVTTALPRVPVVVLHDLPLLAHTPTPPRFHPHQSRPQRPSDIDVVWVYGYGFPMYNGGPLYYAEKGMGLAEVGADAWAACVVAGPLGDALLNPPPPFFLTPPYPSPPPCRPWLCWSVTGRLTRTYRTGRPRRFWSRP